MVAILNRLNKPERHLSFANAVGLEDEVYEGVKAGIAYAGQIAYANDLARAAQLQEDLANADTIAEVWGVFGDHGIVAAAIIGSTEPGLGKTNGRAFAKNTKIDCQGRCLDLSFNSRRDAFRGAKESAGIPVSSQPISTYREPLRDGNKIVRNPDGSPVMTRNYVYNHPQHGRVVIKEHSKGHSSFQGQAAYNPHLNVGKFNGEGQKATNISGISGHYLF